MQTRNPHAQGPWEITRTPQQITVHAERCSCEHCHGRRPPWPLATYRRGLVFVPPSGVPVAALRKLLDEADKP